MSLNEVKIEWTCSNCDCKITLSEIELISRIEKCVVSKFIQCRICDDYTFIVAPSIKKDST